MCSSIMLEGLACAPAGATGSKVDMTHATVAQAHYCGIARAKWLQECSLLHTTLQAAGAVHLTGAV